MGDGRDEKGRFSAGWAGGPGRPPRAREAAYLNVVWNKCTLEDWAEICTAAVQQAKEGDRYAREWLSKYVIDADLAKIVEHIERLYARLPQSAGTPGNGRSADGGD